MMKTKSKTVKETAEAIETTDQLLADFKATIEAIMTDYVVPDSMEVEVAECLKRLQDKLYETVETKVLDADQCLDRLEALQGDGEHISQERLLNLIDEEEMISRLCGENDFFVVKVKSMVDREKIEAFVKSEVYPFYNDQVENLFS